MGYLSNLNLSQNCSFEPCLAKIIIFYSQHFNAILNEKDRWLVKYMAKEISTETAQQIAVEYLKKRKNTETIEISIVEQKDKVWIIRGTCPIDLEGHLWAEKFELIIDKKGKIRSTDFALL